MLRTAFFAGILSVVGFATTTHVRAVAASTTVTQTATTTNNNTSYTETSSYTYDKSEPTVANWDTGWGNASSLTGWDYVGSDNGASAVYLGNGYVLSAGHVGAGNFILDGNTYDLVGGSAKSFGTADLSLFKIDTTSTTGHLLTLPNLSLETTAPTVGSSVVMIGYGNGQGETWGASTVYETGQDTKLTSPSFDSTDFYTQDSFTPTSVVTTGNKTVTTYVTHDGQLVPGDSGGGDFIYVASSVPGQGVWELAGINEVLFEDDAGTYVGSGMVQISNYAADINAITGAPEPPAWCLGFLGLGLLALTRAVRRSRA